MIWIDPGDEPVLLTTIANGKPGFNVLALGEDDDEIIFSSEEALVQWVQRLNELVKDRANAQSYDDWLEENGA